MSDPYERVKGGRLSFKGGSVASRGKAIDKKKKKKKKIIVGNDGETETETNPTTMEEKEAENSETNPTSGVEIYTIDAAKRMKYEELFPVEAKKFGYTYGNNNNSDNNNSDNNNNNNPRSKSNFKSVEDALDDRVKKKADRYCK